MREQRDELSFRFEVDRRLVKDHTAFRFSVVLTEGDGAQGEDAQLPTEERGIRAMGAAPQTGTFPKATCTFCIPPNTTPVQNVKVTGSDTGGICVIGTARIAGGNPDLVKGMIYPVGAAVPSDPPDEAQTAQLVNMPGQPDFDAPDACGDEYVNFVFHHMHPCGLLGGAMHNEDGTVANKVVIWAMLGSMCAGPFSQIFFGKTADTCECEEEESSPQMLQKLVHVGEQAPLVLSAETSFIHLQRPVVLKEFAPESSAAEAAWRSCSKANPEVEWKLWVTTRAGEAYGTLALCCLYGSRLETPLIWRSSKWNPSGVNRLVLESPSEFVGKIPVVTVSPVA